MGFSMRNHGSDKTPYHGGINWNDLDVKDIDITAEDLHFKAGIMSGHAERVSFREKSGYRIESISGNARVGRGKTIIENLKLKDPWSRLDLPEFMMSYENVKAFKDFISRVRLDGDIADSRIDFKTITYFAPQLEGNRLKAGISGRFAGYVDNFDIIGLKIASDAGGFTGTINGSMKGLPEIEKTTIDAKIDKFNMTTEGLCLFLSEWMKDGELDLSRYAKGHTFMVTAKASGLMNRLDINADIYSLIGRADADIRLENITDSGNPIRISGTAETDDLDIGKLISSDLIGPVTLRTGLKAELGKTKSARIDSLFIDRLNLNNYDIIALYSPNDVKALTENYELDKLPVVATFGEATLRAAKEAGLKVKASAPSPEAPSMVKALDIYCHKMEEGLEVEDAEIKENAEKEEFIRQQQSKLQKKTRTRTPKKE